MSETINAKLVNHAKDKERPFETVEEAKDTRQDLIGIGASPEDLEVVEVGEDTSQSQEDSTEQTEQEPRPTEPVQDETESEATQAARGDLEVPDEMPTQSDTESLEATPVKEGLPEEKPSVEEDPVDWLPEHFIDTIKGVPTVNRKGYAVIASQYGVEVTAEPITLAEETDFKYATFRAIARTEDGKEYSGIGSAHVEKRGDDADVLNEMAETRSMKRAVAWATGIGMTAIEEMQSGEQNG